MWKEFRLKCPPYILYICHFLLLLLLFWSMKSCFLYEERKITHLTWIMKHFPIHLEYYMNLHTSLKWKMVSNSTTYNAFENAVLSITRILGKNIRSFCATLYIVLICIYTMHILICICPIRFCMHVNVYMYVTDNCLYKCPINLKFCE